MFRSLILAAVLLASAPLVANAGEITLLPSIKLQIGDRDDYGRYWDGGYWRDRDYWHRHYEWRQNRWWKHDNGYHRGWDSVRLTNAATAKAGKIVTTAVAAGVTEKAEATVTAITINNKKEHSGSFFFYRPAAVPISNHKFNATTTTTMAHPARFTHVEFTRSPISDLLLVKISSGTSASAIPKLSST